MSLQFESITLYEESEILPKMVIDPSILQEISRSFVSYSSKLGQVPPVMQITVPELDGQTCIKSAYVEGLPGYAVKVSSIFPQNLPAIAPVRNGLFLLFNAKTGAVDTIFMDNGYLTQLRTAAAGAVATDLLANKNAENLSIIGSGLQAFMQAQAMCLIREIKTITVWARDSQKGQILSEKIIKELGVECKFEDKIASAIEGADIIVTTTSARSPLLLADHIRPGQHITAMGSDAPGKRELDPMILAKADIYACDSIAQCEKLGELQHMDLGNHAVKAAEIGGLIARACPIRNSANDISVADLTGIGTQDTHIALLARNILAPDRKWRT